MSDELMLMINDDGVAKVYDDTYDITIHCESEEEQKRVLEVINRNRWVPCSERFPKQGDLVLCSDRAGCVHYGFWGGFGHNFYTATTAVADGWWRTPDVVAWMEMPEPWEGDAE